MFCLANSTTRLAQFLQARLLSGVFIVLEVDLGDNYVAGQIVRIIGSN